MRAFRFQWRTRYACKYGHRWSMPFGRQAFCCPVCSSVFITPKARLTKREARRRTAA